ncbi:hypothetical protein [Chryseolinea sp. H1M3-3]|uniref:hypothetical protein n=1 Tax=Chryseolinea sp. H1M3-3 TaxID=3034144 RepID=UPI0023EE0307|nr:hypothetical protein [Chryseolinea sp. H1M3-3]
MAAQKSISCKLTAPELQKRKATVIIELKRLLQYKEEIDNGFSYSFESADDILDKINDFIKTERICCDFFTFQLKVEGSKTFLTITGPAGAKEFLKDEINF